MIQFISVGALALAALVGAPSSAFAKSTGADTVSFAQEAASGGLMEVRLGEIATRSGSSELVRAFGQRMVNDHSKANQELKAEAQRLGLALPAELNKAHAASVEKLQKLSGTELDRAYIDMMVEDHEADVKSFRKESERSGSPLQGFAARTLPTLEQHLDQAREVQKALKHQPEPAGG